MNVSEPIKKKYSGRSEQELLEVIEKLAAQIARQTSTSLEAVRSATKQIQKE